MGAEPQARLPVAAVAAGLLPRLRCAKSTAASAASSPPLCYCIVQEVDASVLNLLLPCISSSSRSGTFHAPPPSASPARHLTGKHRHAPGSARLRHLLAFPVWTSSPVPPEATAVGFSLCIE